MTELPAIATYGSYSLGVKCPWCGRYTDDARVSLQDLCDAHYDGVLAFAKRSARGAAEAGLKVSCVECERPFLIALNEQVFEGQRSRVVRVLAVRSDADLKYLAGEGSW